jgi:general nucleoside transport system permease protein
MTALRGLGVAIAGVALTLGLTGVIVSMLGASPIQAYRLIVAGALGTPVRIAYVLTAWAPILLCSAGLLLTFAAGLWNIGVEGQVVVGAVFGTGMLRAFEHSLPPAIALGLSVVAAVAGGGLWALLAGALREYGNVSEIFGGLGLNFIAGSLTVYLVLGPWARPGIASTSGTLPFDSPWWLPAIRLGTLAIPTEVIAGLGAIVVVFMALRGTRAGLELKAIGRSARAAYVQGVPVTRRVLGAFAGCGGLAGLAGFVLVTGAYSRHQLFPLISGGYGFLAILVVLLATQNAGASMLISAFFAVVSTGSLQLPLQMQLDSSVGGIIQGTLVLTVLLLRGLALRATSSRT